VEEGSILRLILDLDGTLIRLKVDWRGVRRRLEEFLGPLPPGETVFERLSKVEGKEEVEKALGLIEHVEKEGLRSAQLDGEVAELLKDLRRKGVVLALVSMQARDVVEEVLEKMGLREEFEVVVTRDQSLRREEQLREVLSKVGWEDVLFIGDRDEDLEAAAKIGIPAIKARLVDGSIKHELRRLLGSLSKPS